MGPFWDCFGREVGNGGEKKPHELVNRARAEGENRSYPRFVNLDPTRSAVGSQLLLYWLCGAGTCHIGLHQHDAPGCYPLPVAEVRCARTVDVGGAPAPPTARARAPEPRAGNSSRAREQEQTRSLSNVRGFSQRAQYVELTTHPDFAGAFADQLMFERKESPS